MPPLEDVLDDREALRTPDVADPAPKPDTITISKAELDQLKRENAETKASERYWADKARTAAPAPKVDPPADELEIDVSDLVPAAVTGTPGIDQSIFTDPDKWLKAVSEGPKAIEALIKSQGYVNAEQVADIAAKVAQRTVQVERTKITTDDKLMRTFPELADANSDLFKATAVEYQELIAFDPYAKNTPATLFAAAKAARAKLGAAAPKPGDEEDGDRYDRVEGERLRRVAAQDGSRGGRGQRGEEAVTTLGPEARAINRAMGVSDDEVLAERRKLDVGRKRR